MIPLCDLHCDTAYNCFKNNTDFSDTTNHINLKTLEGVYPYVQVLAHYIADDVENKFGYFVDMLGHTVKILSGSEAFKLCKCYNDILIAQENGNYAAVLSIEGGDFFTDDDGYNKEVINRLSELSILFFSACYNKGSNVCAGAFSDDDYGLTKLGEKVVKQLYKSNIIIDLSHISHKSADDILSFLPTGVVATHSNCYELCKHRRNLYTGQIRKIIQKRGLIGINLYPPFLSEKPVVNIDDIVNHILFILELGGKHNVCFGADFDGVETLPEGVKNISDMQRVYDALLTARVPESTVNDIFYNNVKKFIKRVF